MTSSPAKRRHGVQPLPRCDGRWPVSRHDAVAELDEDIALVQAELDAADHAAKDAPVPSRDAARNGWPFGQQKLAVRGCHQTA